MSEELDVMVDLETLGTEPSSIILSIGAITWVDEGFDTFYQEISPNHQGNRTIDIDTIKWWMNQPIKPPMEGETLLHNALEIFNEWLKGFGQKIILWANGTDFDISMLHHAMNEHGMAPVWAYNDVRDYRTMRKIFPTITTFGFTGERHNALDDAMNQLTHLHKIMKAIALKEY